MVKDKKKQLLTGFTLLNNLQSKLRFKKSYLTGFTLIELVIVMTIIIVISSIAFMSFRVGEEQFSLQRSIHMLAQDIRQVQELAMRVENFKGSVSKGGFGIHLETATPSSYILFADCDQDKTYDATGNPAMTCITATTTNPFPEQLKIRELEEGVTIISISPNPISTIVFIPPDPGVRINYPLNITSTTIVLGINNLTATVTVNSAGLIAIE